MKIVKVLTNSKIFPLAEYLYEGQVGDCVLIPFGNKKIYGIVIEIIPNSDYKLKIANYNHVKLSDSYIIFLKNIMQKFIYTPFIVDFLHKFFFKKPKIHKEPILNLKTINIHLNIEQQKILQAIKHQNKNLLFGVTGSGKTELYFKLILEYIEQGKQCLILLPEILLVDAIVDRFMAYFHFQPIVWHSKNRNKNNFNQVRLGAALVVIGY